MHQVAVMSMEEISHGTSVCGRTALLAGAYLFFSIVHRLYQQTVFLPCGVYRIEIPPNLEFSVWSSNRRRLAPHPVVDDQLTSSHNSSFECIDDLGWRMKEWEISLTIFAG